MSFDRKYESIAAPGLRMLFFAVPWDSELLGYPVAQIDKLEIDDSGDASAAFGRFRAWCEERRIRLASCRLPSDRLRESLLLEEQGFRFIEMVYAPECLLEKASPRMGTRLSVSEVGRSDLPAIQSIAGSVFTMGRFLLDWRLDPEASHRRYRAWIQNSFDDPHHKVMKAMSGDEIVGFFIVEERAERRCYWHLAAMAPQWQGKGLGVEMWESMLALHKAAGLSRIETTISAHNVPVLNLYARLGFRLRAPQMTFHWLPRPAP
jgi:RimJ/RimL family protein N-acetyltransferase